MRPSLRTTLLALASTCFVAACATTSDGGAMKAGGKAPMQKMSTTSTATSGSVNLAPASGSLVSGKLALMPVSGGVRITGEVGGLQPNTPHGFHVHETGDCSKADATSAGGHFNPTGNPHGRAGAGPHHAGDMDNIMSNGEGVAKIDVVDTGVTLGGGAANDIANRAVIVHGKADDYTSQPSGDAGPRVACGVIKAQM